jgi:uncharacterized protein (TIGR02145 family)
MRRVILLIAVLFYLSGYGQVGINTDNSDPDASAMLDVQSTSKGMLVPRMNSDQRNAITDPANGLLIFCTDDNLFYMNRGTPGLPEWSAIKSEWISNGSNIYYADGNVGIGETNPQGKLHVSIPGLWAGVVFTGTGLNDLEVDNSGYNSTGSRMFAIRIQNAGPNPNIIEISSDGGSSWSSPTPIATNIDMGYGVYANFANTSGHTYGDLWEWTVNESFPNMLYIAGGSVGIGTVTPDASAQLDVSNTTKGFLPPRMTASQRAAISSPASGLLVYQTDNPAGYYYYTGINWVSIEGAGAGANSSSTCIDYDGNAYPTITIGNQTWMAENLRVTHYSNGDAIPNVTDGSTWAAITTGAYCWYDNDQITNAKYGVLYNWYAVDDSRGICPAGWHEPTDAEWTTFTTFLGGVVAGGKMKSVSALWYSPNVDATNTSGFSGLPGGERSGMSGTGNFFDLEFSCYFWSSTEYSIDFALIRHLYYTSPEVNSHHRGKRRGLSVRCVRD